ncbi:Cysteine-rich receptor-like protein kinase [Melia azedarach]|uniref:Cysteine-rich receptor-like protein kinase n=1 Tax=Melia azedarach TaxID=155640 RepID=A0ACC1X647_MELAZ|nr:Cysteine-rich receptor-like protein kinase [Melia azedarach]
MLTKMMERKYWMKTLATVAILTCWAVKWAEGQQSDMELINRGCSQFNVTNLSDFTSNLNATFKQLRAQLNGGKHFATAQQVTGSPPVYGMVQCRKYLSSAECLACFSAAQSTIRNCSAVYGARVVYFGCFLRYESIIFYDQFTEESRVSSCSNQTALQGTAFRTAAQELLQDLQVATPNINGFFAASTKNIANGNSSTVVYGIAQCVESISKAGCQECLSLALSNIQRCLDYAHGWAVDVGCFLRYSDSPFFPLNQTTDLSPSLKIGGNSRKKKAIIGGAVGAGGISLMLFGLLVWFKISQKRKMIRSRGNISEVTELRGPMNYRHKDLISATKNFSDDNKLGEGGFGDIYKGILNNGKVVAVKKLAIGLTRRVVSDFENEVRLISNVHHRNLIRLLGCSSKGSELLLVYEYMANSSLDKFLFGEKRGSLNWKQRFDIILGTARGLAYMHEDFHVCIIHRDIKPSNILLDDDFQPKIADFGLARLLPEDQTHLSTKFAGTLGYTAPEYAIHGQLSEKADTYSYGVLVLEIVSGKRSSELTKDDDEYLLKRAWTLYENGKQEELMDEKLNPDEYTHEEARRVIEIALMCTQSAASSRPTMSRVVFLLSKEGTLLSEDKPLLRPIFVESDYRRVRDHHQDPSTSTASSTSNATASVTQISGR